MTQIQQLGRKTKKIKEQMQCTMRNVRTEKKLHNRKPKGIKRQFLLSLVELARLNYVDPIDSYFKKKKYSTHLC